MSVRFQLGETLWHSTRECRLVAATSSAYLLLAAVLRPGPDDEPRPEAVELARSYDRRRRDINVVVYADNGSIGFLRSRQLRRKPRESDLSFAKRPPQ